MINGHKLVVLEGIDGVGKTTIATLVAKNLARRGEYASIAPMPPQELIEAVNYMRTSSTKAHFLFYLSIVKHVSDIMTKELAQGHVICARYILSTLAYHLAANVEINISVDELSILQPDLTILLTCEDNERLNRVTFRSKQNTKYDLKSVNETPLLATIMDYYRELGKAYNLHEIETTNITVEEVASKIVAMI